MGTPAGGLTGVIERARQRLARTLLTETLRRWLPRTACAALVGVALASVLAAWLGWSNRWAAMSAAAAASLAGCAIVSAALRRGRPTTMDAAEALDRTHGTRDLVVSAWQLDQSQGAFETMTRAAGSRVVGTLDPQRVGRSGWDRPHIAGAIGIIAAWAVASFMPSWTMGRASADEAVAEAAQLAADVADAEQAIESAREALEEVVEDDRLSEATPAVFEAIDALEAELADGVRDPDEARASAAEMLEQLAESSEREAASAEAQREAIAEQLDAVDPGSFEEAAELARSLAQGDLQRAAEQFDPDAEGQSPELADEYRRLAEMLDEAAQATAEDTSAPNDPAESGISSEAVPPDVPDEPSPAERDLRDLAEALRESAGDREPQPPIDPSVDPPEDPPADASVEDDPPSPPQPDRGPDPEQDAGQNQGAPPEPSPEPSSESSTESGSEPSAEPDAEPNPAGDRQPRPVSSPSEASPSQDRPSENDPAERTPPEGSPQPADQARPNGPSDQPNEQPIEQPADQSSNPDPPNASPSQPDGQRPDGSQPSPSDAGETQPDAAQPDEGTPSPDQPNDNAFDRLAEEQRDAEQARERAERLRERAREILEPGQPDQPGPSDQPGQPGQPTPSQQPGQPGPGGMPSGEPGDGFGPGIGDGPGSPLSTPTDPWDGATDIVDARSGPEQDADESVVAEWYRDPSDAPTDGAITSSGVPTERLRAAERDAERALEQQVVPQRHRDLIRTVFRRYLERAAEPAPDAASRDARDAP